MDYTLAPQLLDIWNDMEDLHTKVMQFIAQAVDWTTHIELANSVSHLVFRVVEVSPTWIERSPLLIADEPYSTEKESISYRLLTWNS